MGFYQDQIVPLLINLAMRRRDFAAYRSRIIPAADGRVLEIGIGSGFNLFALFMEPGAAPAAPSAAMAKPLAGLAADRAQEALQHYNQAIAH